jgi:DNA-binding CsgD family transcriptional regulator
VLDALDGLIASDLSSFNEVDPLGGRAVVVSRPPEAVEPEGFAAWERWSHQHPALMHMLRSGDGSARRLSDYLTVDELHDLEIYREVYAPLEVEFQLSVGLPASRPLVLGVALNRRERDFADDEVAVLDALRPHLVQAYHRVRLVGEQQAAMARIADALASEGRAFCVLGLPLDAPAAELVERHFGPAAGGGLPTVLAGWLDDERRAYSTGPIGRLRQPLVSVREGRRLTVRYLPGGPGEPDLLSLDERTPERDAEPLRRLGLSPREAEALWWLSKGATTAAVAKELGLSVGTVKKHLERVYRKLGVSTRTAAVAQAFDALAGP